MKNVARRTVVDEDDGGIAQDRRNRSGESGAEVNVGRTTAMASSTKVPEAVLNAVPPAFRGKAKYFHESR